MKYIIIVLMFISMANDSIVDILGMKIGEFQGVKKFGNADGEGNLGGFVLPNPDFTLGGRSFDHLVLLIDEDDKVVVVGTSFQGTIDQDMFDKLVSIYSEPKEMIKYGKETILSEEKSSAGGSLTTISREEIKCAFQERPDLIFWEQPEYTIRIEKGYFGDRTDVYIRKKSETQPKP